jgi:hypothetical protein
VKPLLYAAALLFLDGKLQKALDKRKAIDIKSN